MNQSCSLAVALIEEEKRRPISVAPRGVKRRIVSRWLSSRGKTGKHLTVALLDGENDKSLRVSLSPALMFEESGSDRNRPSFTAALIEIFSLTAARITPPLKLSYCVHMSGYQCAQSSTSHTSEASNADAEHPPGVKAAKANGKKVKAEGKTLSQFERMWSIKQEDLTSKRRLSKMKLLDSLIGKQEPLAEYKEALKKKLVTDLYKKSDRVEHCEGNKKRLKLVMLCSVACVTEACFVVCLEACIVVHEATQVWL
ncbi:hypothetical protein F2Q69_00012000 [Brassica cretica]|uniref:Uncharacterized protein n=1 Tax=Brassica cretica TaxID=69181 RepID=A0A8S9QXJ4_BRACR|nr:hypothetical protein F2Q69_00012000 [Brassica cretica]